MWRYSRIGSGNPRQSVVYRDMQDPWLKQLRDAPKQTLLATMPNLEN